MHLLLSILIATALVVPGRAEKVSQDELDAGVVNESPGSASTNVSDNSVATYKFATLPDIVNVSSPVLVSVTALDVEGNVLEHAGEVSLSLILPDGSSMPVSPAKIPLGGASRPPAYVTLPVTSKPGSRLRATDERGATADSSAFDILRVLDIPANDLVWDRTRGRLYASVTEYTESRYANQVLAIDPVSLEVTGSVTTAHNPRTLALATGAKLLYAALDANGTIAVIDVASFSVTRAFAVGTDSSHGTLYAGDLCPAPSKPGTLLVSQYSKGVSPGHRGVAVYDSGIMRATRTPAERVSDIVEQSGDPTIFFGYDRGMGGFRLRKLQIDASGVWEVGADSILSPATRIWSAGDRVFSNIGHVADGMRLSLVGSFPASGTFCPDLALGRAYVLEHSAVDPASSHISAFDPAGFARICRLSLPDTLPVSGDLIRWGTDGLAFRSGNSVVLITSRRLVPQPEPAELSVFAQATPRSAAVGTPVVYSMQILNEGPHAAIDAYATATLSDGQTFVSAWTSNGASASFAQPVVTVPLGTIEPGATVTLKVSAIASLAGGMSCAARVSSSSSETHYGNNAALGYATAGFSASIDGVNQVRVQAAGVVSDPGRQLLWAAIPSRSDAMLGRSVVSIDPTTGSIADLIRINGEPIPRSIALSPNGRYLYVGLLDAPEVARIDLSSKPHASVRIPLGRNARGDASYASDIAPLDGEGTSFMVVTRGEQSAAVYDGAVRRSARTRSGTVRQIEPTASPNVFYGYPASSLNVTASGVAISRSVPGLMSANINIQGAGNLALSDQGYLVDSSSLTLKADLGASGAPCIDSGNGLAHLVTWERELRSFDLSTGLPGANFMLPLPLGTTIETAVRWGADGLALLGGDGTFYLLRSSSVIPAGADQNGDGIADSWAAKYFGTLAVSASGDGDRDGVPNALEYLFGSSPVAPNTPPALQPSVSVNSDAAVLHVVFARRAGVTAGSYGFEVTPDWTQWELAHAATETVLSRTDGADGPLEWIDAAIPMPSRDRGFARLKWLRQ